ncbi:hypothetical protein [Streptomyces liliifuscus]|uniref:Uncharacterized protein n=1 Tax=Streptomyces liliifuscus TaxID=2797636 RepID=A0A7T7RFY9_9ACTN|nr:hypothetical protein [Streptomyces liliifuscus]QQM45166.1 hypothetical protein JEQ17_41045 [Streptomyces liliifuscus]
MAAYTVAEAAYLQYTGDTGTVVEVNVTVAAVCRGCGHGTSRVVMDEDELEAALEPASVWASGHADECGVRHLRAV